MFCGFLSRDTGLVEMVGLTGDDEAEELCELFKMTGLRLATGLVGTMTGDCLGLTAFGSTIFSTRRFLGPVGMTTGGAAAAAVVVALVTLVVVERAEIVDTWDVVVLTTLNRRRFSGTPGVSTRSGLTVGVTPSWGPVSSEGSKIVLAF